MRKREAIEAKYLAERDLFVQGGESINASSAEVAPIDSPCQLSDRITATSAIGDNRNTNNNDVKSVGDFKARLAAKFNEGGSLNERVSKEELIALNERKIKEEKLGEVFIERTFDGDPNEISHGILNETSNIVSETTSKKDDELFFATSTCNQHIYKSNFTQRVTHKVNEQTFSDINFNLIVKNGTSKLQNDDLALGVNSLPCLPIEIPPLLNE